MHKLDKAIRDIANRSTEAERAALSATKPDMPKVVMALDFTDGAKKS